MIELEKPETFREDAAAVVAIKRGDPERYAELVQRHQRRVFAIAWSRLGDATLAEEATQEAFIRGYQRLWLLGDGSRFASWIGSIARNTAISLGLSRRRELARRERWALESSNSNCGEPAEPVSGETLRETLESLPAKHRECLVLFYLEHKSGEEAASVLGISEGAFRVRLHRAKAALREQLEQSLAASLEKLRPSSGLLAGVMGAVLASSTAKAAAAGTATAASGALAKALPLGSLLPYLSWLAFAPTFLLAWFYTQLDERNFRDSRGFRARLFRQGSRARILWMLPFFALMFWAIPIFSRLYGFHSFFLTIGTWTLVTGAITARRLAINRTRYFSTTVFCALLMTATMFAIGLRLLPFSFLHLILLVTIVLGTLIFGDRPLRMDYSLFLRAAAGFLTARERTRKGEVQFGRPELMAFARFLGARWLITNFRWVGDELILRAAPVQSWRWGIFNYLRGWSGGSQLILSPGGTVTARLEENERRQLEQLREEKIDPRDIERRVVHAAENAWQYFRGGQSELAELALGESPEQEIFNVPPAKSRTTRWHRRITLGSAILLALLWTLNYWKPPWMSGLKPVALTEAEVRQALADLNAGGPASLSTGLVGALSFALALPPPDLFTPQSLAEAHAQILHFSGIHPEMQPPSKYEAIKNSWFLAAALNAGWISLDSLGLSTHGFKVHLTRRKAQGWKFRLPRYELPGEAEAAEKFDPMTLAQLRWLNSVGCLELIDREELIRRALFWQVVSGHFPDGRPRGRNWRAVRGLFATGTGSLLQDTYCQLAALETLGGLDRVDREACIKAILKLHHGSGYFAPPDTEDSWKFHVRGDARDTFSAFESLRILGALDRVKKLARWKFRPLHRSPPGSGRHANWEEIEAWVCERRLQATSSRPTLP